tara:strand:+ start:43111 stop:43944 length:834 start_codon:yes stop_codon:yes gene_type:complete
MKKIIILVIISSFIIADTANNRTMGRDTDPKRVSDLSKFKIFTRKAIWETLSLPGMRFMADMVFPDNVISYLDVEDKIVAFTIDDGFCGRDNPNGDMTDEVVELLKKYNAKATFFTSGSHCDYTSYEAIKNLLDNGHELANHSMYDFPYNKYSKEQFKSDFDSTYNKLIKYTDNIPKWYRAPHAKISKTMDNFLDEEGYRHIMCDGFANDTSIPDAKWISSFILRKIKNGSIILIHMPEKGFREWNFEAMDLTLKGLKEQGYKIVTFSELYNIYNNQ